MAGKLLDREGGMAEHRDRESRQNHKNRKRPQLERAKSG